MSHSQQTVQVWRRRPPKGRWRGAVIGRAGSDPLVGWRAGRGQGAAKGTLKGGTVRLTAARSIRMLTCIGQADVWCLQELKPLTTEEIFSDQDEIAWFPCKVEVCLKGPKGGRSSGVSFLGRPWLQVIRKPVRLVEGTVQHMASSHPRLGEVHLYNAYSVQAGLATLEQHVKALIGGSTLPKGTLDNLADLWGGHG